MTRHTDYPAEVSSVGGWQQLADVAERNSVESEEPSPEEAAIAEEMQRKILAVLEPRERRVFLNMLEGLTELEMADSEEMSPRQVRRLVVEIREKARGAIK